jgi:hypothetical protein
MVFLKAEIEGSTDCRYTFAMIMTKLVRILIPQVLFLLFISPLFADTSGTDSETDLFLDQGFNGTLTVRSDGGLKLSMRDGSRIIIGPGGVVDPRSIGKSTDLSLRRDINGRISFAADLHLVLIYTFRYRRDNSWIFMADPLNMVTGFRFDPVTGKIKEVLLPYGKRLTFP